MAVNRISGGSSDPTKILGTLRSNGNVMILDGNGVIFGKDSIVDVGGLIASTGSINPEEVMNGGAFDIYNMTDAAIINNGNITIKEAGLAAFVSPQIENNGTITAKLGKIQLASGDRATLDLYGDGLMEIALDSGKSQKIINTGEINAEGGLIYIQAAAARDLVDNLISNTSTIAATAFEENAGKIILHAGGAHNKDAAGSSKIANSGTIDASGLNTAETGGQIEILADHIHIQENSIINASGDHGGGDIKIGGDYLGGGNTPTALFTEVDLSVYIKNNAITIGNGGQTIIWADDTTLFNGQISARGGAQSGNGGFVETSGKIDLTIGADAVINVGADNGIGGEWLLDPTNVTIQDGGGTVSTATINATLNTGGDVTITTAGAGASIGKITVSNATIDKSVANNDATLTLIANEQIVITNLNLSSTSGDALNVVLNADSDANQSGFVKMTTSTVNTNGGDFIIGGGADPRTTAAWGNASGNDGVTLNNADISTGTGDIIINGQGRIDDPSSTSIFGVYAVNGSVLESTSGDITLRGTAGLGTNNNYGVYLNKSATQITTVSGNIYIQGQGGTSGAAGTKNNHGIYLKGSAIHSTGSGDTIGSITLDGTGGAGEDNNFGILLSDSTGQITTVDGDIHLIGEGDSIGSNAANNNVGMRIQKSFKILSTGTGEHAGTITLDGTGDDAGDNNYGVHLNNGGTLVSAVDGDISITGNAGGNGSNGSDKNFGVRITGGADVTSTGTGQHAANITIEGTGGPSDDQNHGVVIDNSSTVITSIDGNISITGTGGIRNATASATNYGVLINSGTTIETTGTGALAGNITLNGTGGNSGANNLGVYINSGATTLRTNDGDITLIGTGQGTGSNNQDVEINGSTVETTGLEGDLKFVMDSYDFLNTPTLSAAGQLIFTGTSAASNLGLGTGSGDFVIDTALLSNFTIGRGLTIGTEGTGTGSIDIGTLNLSASGYGLSIHGADITVNGALLGDTSILMAAQNDITLNNVLTVNGAGNSLTLAAGNNVINNVGAGALNPGAGRYLIYAGTPNNVTLNGLTPDFKRYNRSFSANAPSTVSELGNGTLYSVAPVITVTADDANREFGAGAPNFTASFGGFVFGDSPEDAFSGLPDFLSPGSPTQPGSSAITPTLGTLTSDLGYQFTFVDGTLTTAEQNLPPRPATVDAGTANSNKAFVKPIKPKTSLNNAPKNNAIEPAAGSDKAGDANSGDSTNDTSAPANENQNNDSGGTSANCLASLSDFGCLIQ